MTPYRRDIDDLDESLFTRDEALRRRTERADMVERGKERTRQEAVTEAELKVRTAAFTQETSRQMILREYESRGLAPLPGALVSLSMRLHMGWRIEQDQDGNSVLVAPPTPEKYVARGECS